jgi:hypothetical protein
VSWLARFASPPVPGDDFAPLVDTDYEPVYTGEDAGMEHGLHPADDRDTSAEYLTMWRGADPPALAAREAKCGPLVSSGADAPAP